MCNCDTQGPISAHGYSCKGMCVCKPVFVCDTCTFTSFIHEGKISPDQTKHIEQKSTEFKQKLDGVDVGCCHCCDKCMQAFMKNPPVNIWTDIVKCTHNTTPCIFYNCKQGKFQTQPFKLTLKKFHERRLRKYSMMHKKIEL